MNIKDTIKNVFSKKMTVESVLEICPTFPEFARTAEEEAAGLNEKASTLEKEIASKTITAEHYRTLAKRRKDAVKLFHDVLKQ